MLSYFSTLFTPETLIALAIGVFVGIAIGAMPGLSATMCVALLIPVSFRMEPIPAMVMLTSSYTAACYGGSFTAIILHTPGTPTNAVTAIDGYELTKKGQGFKAIGVSSIASGIGSIIGGICLLYISPTLANVALKFGAAEYAVLTVFGLTVITSLTGESVVKGLISGVFGLFMATIGVDAITGFPRFTFGNVYLEGGIQLVPFIVGIFSFSQVLVITEDIFKGKKQIVQEDFKSAIQGKLFPSIKEFFSIIPAILEGSVIGTIIGILPGVGGDVSTWVSYDVTRKLSKHKEEFGKGSIEGVATAEASNNAVCGGSLIPMFTLGIPGSGAAAVLMSALMIQGLQPGYNLFTDRADTTYPIILGYLVGSILMCVVGLALAKQIAKVALIPLPYLAVSIIAISCVGAYAIRNAVFDVYMLVGCGFIGYLMKKTGFPAAPAALGFVLGPILEKNFKRSVQLSRGAPILQYYWNRPICRYMIILIIVMLSAPVIIRIIKSIVMKQRTE